MSEVKKFEVTEARFGEVSLVYGMPVIEIIIPRGGDNTPDDDRVGYLAPFRGYKFQVSATPDGQGDCGSTTVIGLGHLRGVMSARDENDHTHWAFRSNRKPKGILEEVVAAYAVVAIEKFCHDNLAFCPRELSVGGVLSDQNWTKFILACCQMIIDLSTLPEDYEFATEER